MATREDSRALLREWDTASFINAIHEGQVALWSWNPNERSAVLDPLARRFWGGLDGGRHTLDALFDRVHADDREATRTAWWASAETGAPYEFEFRVGEGEAHRWISARGAGGSAGRRGDDVLAVFIDVTSLHRADEARQRLIREMAHRTSNLFTVAKAMVKMLAAEGGDADALADEIDRRFTGLAGAYRFAVTKEGRVASAALGEVAAKIIEPFGTDGAVTVDLPNAEVSGDQVVNLAVILHELTTNSVKYGALSRAEGEVSLTGEVQGREVTLRWRERGGPTVTEVPGQGGFGTRLLEQTVQNAFGGTIARRVEDGALAVDLTLDADRLAG